MADYPGAEDEKRVELSQLANLVTDIFAACGMSQAGAAVLAACSDDVASPGAAPPPAGADVGRDSGPAAGSSPDGAAVSALGCKPGCITWLEVACSLGIYAQTPRLLGK